MLVRILISLAVVMAATILAPLLSDQAPSVPDGDVYDALPRVMAPGSEDGLSAGGTLVAYAAVEPEGGQSIDGNGRPW